jgi:microcystin-dependent protein
VRCCVHLFDNIEKEASTMSIRALKKLQAMILILVTVLAVGAAFPAAASADSQPFLGEIDSFSFSFAPTGWAQCNGQLLPINQYQALFALLGTTYGGNGITTFALPNLQGCVPIGYGMAYVLGQVGGTTTKVLTESQLPTGIYNGIQASTGYGTAAAPGQGLYPARPWTANHQQVDLYSTTPGAAGSTTSTLGNSQPFNTMPPYLVVNYCIALQGIFPSRD